MPIQFSCTCGKAYRVPGKFAGRKVKCKQCDEHILVPSEGGKSKRSSAVGRSGRQKSASNEASGSQRKSKRIRDKGRSSRVSSEGRSSRISKGRSSRVSKDRSSRVSARRSARSARSSTSSKRSRSGSGTERFKPLDLTEGNKIKVYQKSKEEEFGRGEGRITYFEDGRAVKAFRLGRDETVVGRDASCGITIDLSSLSRQHMKIEYKLGTFIATDLESTNGILVNGRQVRRSSLRSKDIVQLGSAILRVDC